MYSLVKGDPILITSKDGIDFHVQQNRIVCTTDINNFIYISLAAEKDMSHFNAIVDNDYEKIKRSKYVEACSKPINVTTLSDISKAAISDLKPLIDLKYVKNVDAKTYNSEEDKIETELKITLNDGTVKTYIVTRDENATILTTGE